MRASQIGSWINERSDREPRWQPDAAIPQSKRIAPAVASRNKGDPLHPSTRIAARIMAKHMAHGMSVTDRLCVGQPNRLYSSVRTGPERRIWTHIEASHRSSRYFSRLGDSEVAESCTTSELEGF